MNEKPLNLNVSLQNTTSIESPNGGKVFAQGFILRKISKFLTGSDEDAILPIQVFYDVKTMEVLQETLPEQLREEFSKKD